MDLDVVEKISQFQRLGVTTVAEVGRHLRQNNELPLGERQKLVPPSKDRLYLEKNNSRFALDDQENLIKFCEKLQKERPKDSIFIRVSTLHFYFKTFTFFIVYFCCTISTKIVLYIEPESRRNKLICICVSS